MPYVFPEDPDIEETEYPAPGVQAELHDSEPHTAC